MSRLDHQRRAVNRWRKCARLTSTLERVLEATARLDAYDHLRETRGRPSTIDIALCQRMDKIAARIGHQLDRLTAELLQAQLAEKMQRDARTVAA